VLHPLGAEIVPEQHLRVEGRIESDIADGERGTDSLTWDSDGNLTEMAVQNFYGRGVAETYDAMGYVTQAMSGTGIRYTGSQRISSGTPSGTRSRTALHRRTIVMRPWGFLFP
jgi:hypothetical protein